MLSDEERVKKMITSLRISNMKDEIQELQSELRMLGSILDMRQDAIIKEARKSEEVEKELEREIQELKAKRSEMSWVWLEDEEPRENTPFLMKVKEGEGFQEVFFCLRQKNDITGNSPLGAKVKMGIFNDFALKMVAWRYVARAEWYDWPEG